MEVIGSANNEGHRWLEHTRDCFYVNVSNIRKTQTHDRKLCYLLKYHSFIELKNGQSVKGWMQGKLCCPVTRT